MPGKICSKCKTFKSYNRYNKDCTKPDGYKPSCKSCRKIETQNYIKNNKDKIKEYYNKNNTEEFRINKRKYDSKRKMQCKNNYLKRTYGINLTEYNNILNKQNNKCALCNRKFKEKIYVDHCHKTGKVRELLCIHCNTSLGHFNDDIILLNKAIKYLEKHNGNT